MLLRQDWISHPRAPRWTSSLAGVYVWNVGSGDLSAHSIFRYQSFTKLAATAPSITDQGGYSVLDVGLAYALGKSWRFAVEGKNILDKGTASPAMNSAVSAAVPKVV